jgi:hypothetical protein
MAMYFCRRLALSVKGKDKLLLAHFQNGRLNIQKDDMKKDYALAHPVKFRHKY